MDGILRAHVDHGCYDWNEFLDGMAVECFVSDLHSFESRLRLVASGENDVHTVTGFNAKSVANI